MLIKLTLESGVNFAEVWGELDSKDKQKAIELVSEKAKGLFLTLHPEMKI